MKENPNQAYHGMIFSMSQGKVSLWVNQLSCLLEEALKKMDKMPRREANKFYNFLYAFVDVIMFMDVAERKIGRSPGILFVIFNTKRPLQWQKGISYFKEPINY
jgi:hypothetical protein